MEVFLAQSHELKEISRFSLSGTDAPFSIQILAGGVPAIFPFILFESRNLFTRCPGRFTGKLALLVGD